MNGFKYIRTQIINQTMKELAIQLNISKQAVYAWENGRRNIPDMRLKQLSELSGIPEKYFHIEELSERDKLEIKKHRTKYELDCLKTMVEMATLVFKYDEKIGEDYFVHGFINDNYKFVEPN